MPHHFIATKGITGPESVPIALMHWPMVKLREYFSGGETSRMIGLPATCKILAPAPSNKTVARNR